MKKNPHYGNVGNRGDILKHAALLRLAGLTASESRGRIVYMDTHAFLLSAPCPEVDTWLRETTEELSQHSGYYDYLAAEQKVMKNHPYRCSAGLVHDAFRERGIDDFYAVLAESDVVTRRQLGRQLKKEGWVNYVLLDNAGRITGREVPGGADRALILVDPFRLDAAPWDDLCTVFAAIAGQGIEMILEVFTFDREGPSVEWPEASGGMGKPVAAIHRQPYNLAVYASPSLRDSASSCCSSLGWETQIRKVDGACTPSQNPDA